jgi:hypothetical protein
MKFSPRETAYTWGGTPLMYPNKFTIIPTAHYKMPTIPSSNLFTLTWLISQPTLSHLNSKNADWPLQLFKKYQTLPFELYKTKG